MQIAMAYIIMSLCTGMTQNKSVKNNKWHITTQMTFEAIIYIHDSSRIKKPHDYLLKPLGCICFWAIQNEST